LVLERLELLELLVEAPLVLDPLVLERLVPVEVPWVLDLLVLGP